MKTLVAAVLMVTCLLVSACGATGQAFGLTASGHTGAKGETACDLLTTAEVAQSLGVTESELREPDGFTTVESSLHYCRWFARDPLGGHAEVMYTCDDAMVGSVRSKTEVGSIVDHAGFDGRAMYVIKDFCYLEVQYDDGLVHKGGTKQYANEAKFTELLQLAYDRF